MSFRNCGKLCTNQKLRLLLGSSTSSKHCTLSLLERRSGHLTFKLFRPAPSKLDLWLKFEYFSWPATQSCHPLTSILHRPSFLYAIRGCTSTKGETEVAVTFSPDAASPGIAHIKDANPARGSRRSCVPAAGYVPLAQSNLLAYPWKASPRPGLRQDLNTRTMTQCCPHPIASQGSASSRLSQIIF